MMGFAANKNLRFSAIYPDRGRLYCIWTEIKSFPKDKSFGCKRQEKLKDGLTGISNEVTFCV